VLLTVVFLFLGEFGGAGFLAGCGLETLAVSERSTTGGTKESRRRAFGETRLLPAIRNYFTGPRAWEISIGLL
jgi:hypothetical protein